MAKREKELGNEFFNSKDYEEALRHYNTSISIHSTLEAKNNRAMSCKLIYKYLKFNLNISHVSYCIYFYNFSATVI